MWWKVDVLWLWRWHCKNLGSQVCCSAVEQIVLRMKAGSQLWPEYHARTASKHNCQIGEKHFRSQWCVVERIQINSTLPIQSHLGTYRLPADVLCTTLGFSLNWLNTSLLVTPSVRSPFLWVSLASQAALFAYRSSWPATWVGISHLKPDENLSFSSNKSSLLSFLSDLAQTDDRAPGCQREYESRAAVNTVVLHPNQVLTAIYLW